MNPASTRPIIWIALLLVILMSASAFAEADGSRTSSDAATAAAKEAEASLVKGPAIIPIFDQAEINLPEGYGYMPALPAKKLLISAGRSEADFDASFAGLVFPMTDQNASWCMALSFDKTGHVNDDKLKQYPADKIQELLQQSFDKSNEENRKKGLPDMETGWIEKPAYDEPSHRFTFAYTRGIKGNPQKNHSFNAVILGREGCLGIETYSPMGDLDVLRAGINAIALSTTFKEGKRYADFNKDTDKLAEYGLMAVVAGAAAKKIGLFSILAKYILGAGGALAGILVYFRKKKSDKNKTSA